MFEALIDLARWTMKWVVSLPERRKEQARREYAIWRQGVKLRRHLRNRRADVLSADGVPKAKDKLP